MGAKITGGYRVAATLNKGMKEKITTYAKRNEMRESEVIKEGLRQLFKKD